MNQLTNPMLDQVQRNEQLAIEHLLSEQPTHAIACIKAWESCALLVLEYNMHKWLSVAVDQWLRVAQQAYPMAVRTKLIPVLVSCTRHHELAQQLFTHPSALVRCACAQWFDLALYLKEDPVAHVRAACTSHFEIAESLMGDRDVLVLTNIALKHEELAFRLTGHDLAQVRLACMEWNTSLELLVDDPDPDIASVAYQKLNGV